jgi:hypothetical protein
MSDQTVTPFALDFSVSVSGFSVFRVRVGEPGGGRLGVTGPVCGSPEAEWLLLTLNDRLSAIRWVYEAEI